MILTCASGVLKTCSAGKPTKLRRAARRRWRGGSVGCQVQADEKWWFYVVSLPISLIVDGINGGFMWVSLMGLSTYPAKNLGFFPD